MIVFLEIASVALALMALGALIVWHIIELGVP